MLTSRWPMAQSAAIMLASLMAGGFLMTHQLASLKVELPQQAVTYRAVVASRPQERGKVMRMDLWLVDDEALPQRVKASVMVDSLRPEARRLMIGDGIVATSRLEEPSNYYDSNFDYPLYLRCHGFTATTLVYPDEWERAVVDLTPLSRTDRGVLAAMKFRQQTMEKYLAEIDGDEEMAVAVAMTMGDKTRLTNELRDVYSISGASHVLALSGLHLGVIYMLLSLMVGSRRLGALREVLIILGIWSYAVVTGLSPSVVRAALMISIYALVSILRRNRMSLNALAFAAIVMLVANPLCLYDVGFQMSVMAVFAILLFYQPIYRLVSTEFLLSHRILAWGWAMVVVSCCAQLGVAPLTAYYFGRFSVYFLLTNFIVIPLATCIIYLAVVMIVASVYAPAMQVVAQVLRFAVGLQNSLVEWVSSLPGASIEGVNINRLQLLLIYVFMAAVIVIVHRLGILKGITRRRK